MKDPGCMAWHTLCIMLQIVSVYLLNWNTRCAYHMIIIPQQFLSICSVATMECRQKRKSIVIVGIGIVCLQKNMVSLLNVFRGVK